MGRLLVLLVTLSGVSCHLYDPFDLPALPKTVHLDPAFTEMERELILGKIDMVNRELGALVGYDILLVGEPLDDPDGFDADGSDMGDDVHGIYRIDRDGEAYRSLASVADREFGGYATLGDVLIVVNLDGMDEILAELAEIEAIEGWQDDEELSARHSEVEGQRRTILYVFRKIVAHELGHHVGLSHNPDPETLMYPDGRPYESVQPGDKEAFCFVRGCAYP